jgi:hypothetical protein
MLFRPVQFAGSRACRVTLKLLVAAALAFVSVAAQAQRRAPAAPRQNAPQGAKKAGNGQGNHPPNGRAMAGLPPKWVEKLQQMPPEERERFMRNNARFQNLPPDRQQQIRRRLQQYDRLTPEQQSAITHREQVFRSMTPAQREHVRNDLAPRWQQLPQDRRQVIKSRLQALSNMPEAQRQQLLNDPKFMQGLTPNEQDLLRNLNGLRNPGP